jgi:hypothetical protein
LGGALDTVPVLREFLKSAKGAAARRQTGKEHLCPLGGALDTVPVLREFLKSAISIYCQSGLVRFFGRSSFAKWTRADCVSRFLPRVEQAKLNAAIEAQIADRKQAHSGIRRSI